MTLGDANQQVTSLYKQAEALATLCGLDHRKYEKQYIAATKELMDAILEYTEPSSMMALVRHLTRHSK